MTIAINREGWDKNIPSYTGGGDGGVYQIQQNFFQESKHRCKGYFVVDYLILRGGGLIKNVGQIIHFQHGSGARTFPDFLTRKSPCSTFDFWSESRRFDSRRPANHVRVQYRLHGEEHVKKFFSTAVIVNEDTHSNLVRGHCFTGEDTNIFHPWSLKLEGFFRKSTNISFNMVTNLFIYITGSSHIIDDCSRAVCFGQSLIGL